MKRAFLLCALCLTGCATNMIRADAIDGTLRRVAERHDVYIQADPDLDELERDIYLRDTELLRRLLDEAGKER